MTETHRSIFGRATALVAPSRAWGERLIDEVGIYPPASASPALTIVASEHFDMVAGGWSNPGIHTEFDDGFVASYPGWHVGYTFLNARVTSIRVAPTDAPAGLAAWVHKWRSVQFTHPLESIGQAVHELALVPATLLEPSMAAVHASAIVDSDGRGILIGGTGGVGKTSMSLELCLNHGAAFVADDIVVVDRHGMAHPNLAYPKVYGYNVLDDAAVTSALFRDRSRADRLQWRLKEARVGPASVRRRVRPDTFYPAVCVEPAAVAAYLILVRSPNSVFQIRSVSADVAAQLSADVLAAEYSAFLQHVHWRSYNQLASGKAPETTARDLVEAWRVALAHALAGVDCRVVHIPSKLSANELRQRALGLIA